MAWGVDTQRELRVGVPELVHYAARVAAERDQNRRERVPKFVRRHAARERMLPALGEQLVGKLEHGLEHALVT
jgi:hypothetical protein